tara:strand:+ start:1355 stop:1510 length:156 start_codon:yes stop_codon:yes gene_type:complete
MDISNEEFKRQWDEIFGENADMRDIAVNKKKQSMDRESISRKLEKDNGNNK